MKTDIEIAQEVQLERIDNVAEKIGISSDSLEHYGKYIAKLPLSLLNDKKGKLILVTAITATKAGIGKTTVSIGLALGLNKIGYCSLARAISWTLLRNEGRCSRWRICSGAAYGEDKSSFYRRFSRNNIGA